MADDPDKTVQMLADNMVYQLRKQHHGPAAEGVTLVILGRVIARIMYDAHKKTENDLEKGLEFLLAGIRDDLNRYASGESVGGRPVVLPFPLNTRTPK